jgi:hypothetical protein
MLHLTNGESDRTRDGKPSPGGPMTPREFSLGVVEGGGSGEWLEVVCREQESRTVDVELRLLVWGKGVGWYSQRTLPLPRNLTQLRALLRRAERQSQGSKAGAPRTKSVVRFPDRGTGFATPASA